MNINTVILETLGLGIVVSLLAILAERVLIITGLTRGNTIGLVIATLILAVLKQVLDFNGSNILFGFLIVVVGTISANRYDIVNTIKKGRWWWR
jgi:hypothetical protein